MVDSVSIISLRKELKILKWINTNFDCYSSSINGNCRVRRGTFGYTVRFDDDW